MDDYFTDEMIPLATIAHVVTVVRSLDFDFYSATHQVFSLNMLSTNGLQVHLLTFHSKQLTIDEGFLNISGCYGLGRPLHQFQMGTA